MKRQNVNLLRGETMNETEHQKLITQLKASCVAAHLAFLNAEHTNCEAADDDYIRAKSDYEKALAAHQTLFSKYPYIFACRILFLNDSQCDAG